MQGGSPGRIAHELSGGAFAVAGSGLYAAFLPVSVLARCLFALASCVRQNDARSDHCHRAFWGIAEYSGDAFFISGTTLWRCYKVGNFRILDFWEVKTNPWTWGLKDLSFPAAKQLWSAA